MWCFWLIVAGVFFIIEIATVGFLIFWLGVGALLAMITSFLTNSIFIQTIVFVITSCILIPLTKPLADKFVGKNIIPTNTSSLINKHGVVIMDINPIQATGQVKVNGEIWSAKSENELVINKGTEIEVLKIDGVKLIVSPIKVNSVL
ncbi:MAG: NfeD family protein [Clostridia bacterium]|nr:NfeD family protein [Clostridia bacterium]